jgi:hypothetical protein
MVSGRGALETGTQFGGCQPFAARPIPQGAKGDRQTDLRWTAGQFEELQRVLKEYEQRIAALEQRIAALEAIVGNGSWDGGA